MAGQLFGKLWICGVKVLPAADWGHELYSGSCRILVIDGASAQRVAAPWVKLLGGLQPTWEA